jgi:hypothetical protein
MSGRSRRWVCCLAVVVLTALSGWRVMDSAVPHRLGIAGSAASVTSADSGAPRAVHGQLGALPDVADDAIGLHTRRVVAEPATTKRIELERLAAVAVAAAMVLLTVLVARFVLSLDRHLHGLLERSRLRSRAPPLSFVS